MTEVVELHNLPSKLIRSFLINMGSIVINGKRVNYTGTISIENGRFFLDGKELKDLESLTKDQKHIEIKVEGDIDRLQVDTCDNLYIEGSCNKVNTVNGEVEIGGNVLGDVESVNGYIEIHGYVIGDVKTVNGNIKRK